MIDLETTGFSPAQCDRIIEIAVARVDASGRILG
ncbi:exonuclease domain-containing protein [Actinopolymorpha singaporensis]